MISTSLAMERLSYSASEFSYSAGKSNISLEYTDSTTGSFSTPLATEDSTKEINEQYEKYRNSVISGYEAEILSLIQNDEYIDGEISFSELFMEEIAETDQLNYAMDALMKLYIDNFSNANILEGILVMVGSIPYEKAYPKGQNIALGLVSHVELSVRDRAIQCFEHWNSKKGLNILKQLQCSPPWLQNYVNKVIMYIERDGDE